MKGRVNYKEDESPKLIVEELSPLEKNDMERSTGFSVSSQDNVNVNDLKELISCMRQDAVVFI